MIPAIKRRSFLKQSSSVGIGISTGAMISSHLTRYPEISQTNDINIVGPKEGYTPEIGTLVSMMNWMRQVVVSEIRDLSIKELDYLHDDEANTIGAMIWHLAATERFYQINTFDEDRWQGFPSATDSQWDAAANLGINGRRLIKGYDIDFYLELLENVRDYSLEELKKKDDDWLTIVDHNFWTHPTNNYCKWFHVVEHESNHNGQIRFLKKRVS